MDLQKLLRLAMLGMVDGNGHPYSWSAIINGGYDADLMTDCGFPVIPQYLSAQAPSALGIANAAVTHVWCEDAQRASHIARTCRIEHVVADPRSVIGHVDAVIIPTDVGDEHLDRARPFIEAGLPVFIDKPLTTDAHHLQQFARWHREGKRILSTSAMRYAHEFKSLRERIHEVGKPRLITVTAPKTWERYGIHAMEALYGLLEPGGWVAVANTGSDKANIIHLRHRDGVDVIIAAIYDLGGHFCPVNIYGTSGMTSAQFSDTFSAFKAQLVAFVDYARTGREPFDFAQTVEQMKIIIAGTRSRMENGRTVLLSEI
jgi:predicted dehydrogenase